MKLSILGISQLIVNNANLSVVTSDAFTNENNIQLLDLSSNQLTDISFDQGSHLNKVMILNLNNNNISSIAPNSFEKLEMLKSMTWHHSYWNIIYCVCNSSIKDLVSSLLVCVLSNLFRKKLLTSVFWVLELSHGKK